MKRITICLILALSTAGCAPMRAAPPSIKAPNFAKIEAVLSQPAEEPDETVRRFLDMARDNMKDPESARFRRLRYYPEAKVLCGDINAKMGAGGYAGYQPFAGYYNVSGRPVAVYSAGATGMPTLVLNACADPPGPAIHIKDQREKG